MLQAKCRLRPIVAGLLTMQIFSLYDTARAQAVSGSITGTVVDSSGAIIAAAAVTLLNERTGDTRRALTTAAGSFVFPAVQPAVYTIRVSQQGFSTLERTGNVLSANENLALGDLMLNVGSTSESVQVVAQGALVQTGSGENSALLTSSQLQSIGTRGRDATSLLRLLPGVAVGAENETPGGPGYGNSLPNIMGRPANWSSASIDGLSGNDLGSGQFFSSPNLDAVSEVKVLLNTYQAEYGGNGGAIINMVTKSGAEQFHGSAYWYKRHEMFNANNFFNNSLGIAKPRYRYNTLGASLGGPIPLPKVKDRLFFFYSIENWRIANPAAIIQRTLPTEAERLGDFSNTLDVNGAVIPIRDPLNGNQPFPGNVIPSNRIDPSGQAILRLFPMPNALDRSITRGNYNFNFQEAIDLRKTQNVFRVDYRLTEKDTLYVRGSIWITNNVGYAVPANGPNFPLEQAFYAFNDSGIVVNHTHIFTPSIVNEFSIGMRQALENGGPATDAELDKIVRDKTGVAIGQLYPQNNPLNIIPQMSFAGVNNAPSIAFDLRFPIRGADTMLNINDSLSIIQSRHTFKLGFFLARGANGEGLRGRGNFPGQFAFGRDVNNPLDTNYAYSNALLGTFQSYTESSTRPQQKAQILYGAFFLQDTWKVTRRLTLDLGVRVDAHQWYRQANDNYAGFRLERFDPANAPVLYRPVSTPAGRRGLNPLTGEIVPAVAIGAYVPSTGNVTNGIVLAGESGLPPSFREPDGLLPAPRLGFAWDVFGDGKTAIRGGFGIFHQLMEDGNFVSNLVWNPPIQFNPQVYYSTFGTLLNGGGYLFPGNTYSYDPKPKTQSVYNFSFGVQREIGFASIVSASYVGTLGRHLQQTRQLNTVPYGSRFLPQNADPTNPALPLNDNFFRPFPGYANVAYNENASSSNYHSLQLTANRRFVRGLQFGVSYTWSKAMNYTDSDGGAVAMYAPLRAWNYGKAAFDQTHVFVANYTWELPRFTKLVPSRLLGYAFDNWQFSGITMFASGMPQGIGFSTVDGADITGGGDGSRANVVGKAQLPHSERTLTRWFDPTVFSRPARGDFGNAPKDVFRGPGFNNWDLFFFKNVPLLKEDRVLQFRWEMYNAFNHTQFQGVDNAARFDAGGAQVNGRFAQAISARSARVMQASIRFVF